MTILVLTNPEALDDIPALERRYRARYVNSEKIGELVLIEMALIGGSDASLDGVEEPARNFGAEDEGLGAVS